MFLVNLVRPVQKKNWEKPNQLFGLLFKRKSRRLAHLPIEEKTRKKDGLLELHRAFSTYMHRSNKKIVVRQIQRQSHDVSSGDAASGELDSHVNVRITLAS
jgi:hypothetical protein